MLRAVPVIWAVMCAASMCLAGLICSAQKSPEEQAAAHLTPTKFSLYLGNNFFGFYTVELQDNTLVYTNANPAEAPKKIETLTPSSADWKRFWKTMDEVHLWKWKPFSTYDQTKIMDGTQWMITIQQSGKHGKQVKTGGSNAFPSDKDVTRSNHNPQPSRLFLKYREAVRDLIGKRDFR